MFESPRSRLLLLVGALLVLAGLLVYAGTLRPDPAAGAYPAPDDYATDPGPYVGEKVTAAGIVTDEDPPTVQLRGGTGEHAEFELEGLAHAVERGEGVRAFGVLREGRRIAVIRSFPVAIRGLWYAYLVSFLAGAWALSLLARTWRFDRQRLGLVPRDRPLTLGSLVADRFGGDGDG